MEDQIKQVIKIITRNRETTNSDNNRTIIMNYNITSNNRHYNKLY